MVAAHGVNRDQAGQPWLLYWRRTVRQLALPGIGMLCGWGGRCIRGLAQRAVRLVYRMAPSFSFACFSCSIWWQNRRVCSEKFREAKGRQR